MVILDRLSYIRSLMLHGAKVTTSSACNTNTGIEKVKFIIDSSVRVDVGNQQAAFAMVDMLIQAVGTYSVADRGHKHSSGKSEISFYLDYNRCPNPRKAWGVNDSVAELALLGLTHRVSSCSQHCEKLIASIDPVPDVIPFVAIDAPTLEGSSLPDLELGAITWASLERFRGQWESLIEVLHPPANLEIHATGCESRSLIVNGALNGILNGRYYHIGAKDGRTLWQSLSGVHIYFDGTSQSGWCFGYKLQSDQILAFHPSVVSMTPPPTEWDCLLFDCRDEGLSIQVGD